jgi:hypothetical protein
MQRLTATGARDPSFGSLLVNPAARFADGRWLVTRFSGENSVGSPARPMDADGHPLATAAAFVSSIARLPGDSGGMFAALADGTALYLTIGELTGHVGVTKVKLDGTVLRRATFDMPVGTSFIGAIASRTGAIADTTAGVLRLPNDGSRDSPWGLHASRQAAPLEAMKLVPWDKGGVAVLSANDDTERFELTLISHTGRVARRVGLASATFNDYGGPFNYTLAVDPRGRLLLARSYAVHSGTTVSRYVGGLVDRTFGVMHLKASHSVDAEGITVMPDGRIVVLGELQRWGTIYGHNNAPIPGFEDHGTVLGRLHG